MTTTWPTETTGASTSRTSCPGPTSGRDQVSLTVLSLVLVNLDNELFSGKNWRVSPSLTKPTTLHALERVRKQPSAGFPLESRDKIPGFVQVSKSNFRIISNVVSSQVLGKKKLLVEFIYFVKVPKHFAPGGEMFGCSGLVGKSIKKFLSEVLSQMFLIRRAGHFFQLQ